MWEDERWEPGSVVVAVIIVVGGGCCIPGAGGYNFQVVVVEDIPVAKAGRRHIGGLLLRPRYPPAVGRLPDNAQVPLQVCRGELAVGVCSVVVVVVVVVVVIVVDGVRPCDPVVVRGRTVARSRRGRRLPMAMEVRLCEQKGDGEEKIRRSQLGPEGVSRHPVCGVWVWFREASVARQAPKIGCGGALTPYTRYRDFCGHRAAPVANKDSFGSNTPNSGTAARTVPLCVRYLSVCQRRGKTWRERRECGEQSALCWDVGSCGLGGGVRRVSRWAVALSWRQAAGDGLD